MLGRKQKISNDDWIKAAVQIEKLVSRQQIETAAERVLTDIQKRTVGKKVAYAWSGGKDSLEIGRASCRERVFRAV